MNKWVTVKKNCTSQYYRKLTNLLYLYSTRGNGKEGRKIISKYNVTSCFFPLNLESGQFSIK